MNTEVDEDFFLRESSTVHLYRHFIDTGAAGLHERDILRLFLCACNGGTESDDLADRLLDTFGDLPGILNAPYGELLEVRGISTAIAVALHLICESSARLAEKRLRQGPLLDNRDALLKYCKTRIARLKVEQLHVFYLDRKKHLIRTEMISEGTDRYLPVCMKEVVRKALNAGAGSLVLVHNHPRGTLAPSGPDRRMTLHIGGVLAMLDIELEDHIIIAGDRHFSFYDHGMM